MLEDPAALRFREDRLRFWEAEAARPAEGRRSASYHRFLRSLYAFHVPPGLRVLELGCGRGDLLAAVRPSEGVGVDFCPGMVERARERHPGLRFEVGDAAAARGDGPFDCILLSDLVNDLWDVQAALESVRALCGPRTRVYFNFFSRLWQLPRAAAETLGWAVPIRPQNWLTVEDLGNLLTLTGFETVRRSPEILWPFATPLWAGLCNRWLVRCWPFRELAMTNFLVARPAAAAVPERERARVSVVVPARNEAGNIEALLRDIPEMGGGTEILFVEGGSTDGTREAIAEALRRRPDRDARLLVQSGKGKADAVRLGFAEAKGDLLLILDADRTVPPEDLPRFFAAWRDGRGDFINGVRLVYPMEDEAMRFCNLVANKFFGLAFSWLLGQTVKDTLCGTKGISREDYARLAAGRTYFGDFDPFGDFDLIFGAAKLGLRILDLPVRYRARTYGETNISRWKHGAILLRMLLFACRRLKFVGPS